VHSAEPGFTVLCGVNNCQKSNTNITALCKHMRRKHKSFFAEHMIASKVKISTTDSNTDVNECTDDDCMASDVAAANPSEPNSVLFGKNDVSQLTADKYVALWSLKLRERYRISGAACDEIRENTADMLSQSRMCLLNRVTSKMSQFHATPQLTDAVRDIISTPTTYEVSFQQLTTESQVNKYIESNFAFVEPVQYKLRNLSADDSSIEYMQYVPLLQSLKTLLQNDDMFSSVINSHQSADNRMRDFCDGSLFQQHPLFSSNFHALQIILYYDEFTAVNPLGHRAKKYKISAFYFMLGNVHPKDCSRLHTIYLVVLCYATAMKKCGFDEVLRPLINDLTFLAEQGIVLERTDVTVTLHGALSAVVADNLAAHSIGGYLESFSSIHPCRFCIIRKDKLKCEFVYNQAHLRTAASYDSQCLSVSRDQSFQSVYGLKRKSALNAVPHFHVISGLPSDVMHDLLEGVVCDVLESAVNHFVMTGSITLNFLNQQIEKFPYAGNDRCNKPDVLTEATKFRQTAAKCRCLLQLLPLMIGHKIPAGDEKWEILLSLLQVHDLAFAPVLSEADTYLLDEAVEHFLGLFSHVFDMVTVKPKMHYLVHYGTQCRMFGPLVQFRSFRFEGKHGYFKDLACRLKCRKNVLLTLAKKHQYYQSWHLNCTGPYLHEDKATECRGTVVAVTSLPSYLQSLLQPVLVDSCDVFQASSAVVNGVKYESDLAVVTAVENYIPSFSLITSLFVVDSKLYIAVTNLGSQKYCRHFHCYTAAPSTESHLFTVHNLVDPFPLPVYAATDGALCIILRHHICLDSC